MKVVNDNSTVNTKCTTFWGGNLGDFSPDVFLSPSFWSSRFHDFEFVNLIEFVFLLIALQNLPLGFYLALIDGIFIDIQPKKKRQETSHRSKKNQPGARSAWTISPPTQFLGTIAKSSMQSTHWIWQIPTLPTFPTVDDLECLTMQKKKHKRQFKFRSLWTIWTNVPHKSMKVSSVSSNQAVSKNSEERLMQLTFLLSPFPSLFTAPESDSFSCQVTHTSCPCHQCCGWLHHKDEQDKWCPTSNASRVAIFTSNVAQKRQTKKNDAHSFLAIFLVGEM